MAVISETKTEISHRKNALNGNGVVNKIKSVEISKDQGKIRIKFITCEMC